MLLIESLLNVRQKNATQMSDEEFAHLLEYDPNLYTINNISNETLQTATESFSKWLIKMYNKGELNKHSPEDVRTILGSFEYAKSRRNLLPNNDINSYQTLDEIGEALRVANDRLSTNQKNKDAKNNQKNLKKQEKNPGMYMNGAVELLFNGNNWEVWTPHTYEGSKALRRGAVWCTGGDTSTHYDLYTHKGTLYVIMNKKDNSDKYQLFVPFEINHLKSYEYRDKDNDAKSFRMLCLENPELLQFFETRDDVVQAYPNLEDEEEAYEERESIEWDEYKEEEVASDFGLYWDDWVIYMGVDGVDIFAKNDYLTTDMVHSFLTNGYVDSYESEKLNDLIKILLENRDFQNCFYEKGYFDVLIELFKKEVPNYEIIDEVMVDTIFGLKDSPAYDETLAKWLQNRWVKVTSDNPSGDYVDDVVNCISTMALDNPLYDSIKDMLWNKCDISERSKPSNYILKTMDTNHEIPSNTGYETIRDFYEAMRDKNIHNYSDYIEHYDIHWPNEKVEKEVENCDEFENYNVDYAEEDADRIVDLFASISDFNNSDKENIDESINDILKNAGII